MKGNAIQKYVFSSTFREIIESSGFIPPISLRAYERYNILLVAFWHPHVSIGHFTFRVRDPVKLASSGKARICVMHAPVSFICMQWRWHVIHIRSCPTTHNPAQISHHYLPSAEQHIYFNSTLIVRSRLSSHVLPWYGIFKTLTTPFFTDW